MSELPLELKRPEKTLPSGWEARIGLNGRVYYHSHHSRTLQILPPPNTWSCAYDLPYGWELALDYEDQPYFINHVLSQVTYVDPRMDNDVSGGNTTPSYQPPPHLREYTIPRKKKLGFGFIAGSEQPVIVRSVTPGGPSEGMLLPGDQIVKIGGMHVANAPRENVISLIKQSEDEVTLTVIQPPVVENSSFLKPSKKLVKGMNKHRVRFSESSEENQEVMANGSSLLVSPNVLRVHLGEGKSRSFEFNSETTAGDVVSLLCEELKIHDNTLYSLVLKPRKSHGQPFREHTSTKFSDDILVPPWDLISKVLSNPSIKHHECHFRLAFVAKDVHKLSREDPNSFNYLYQQCVDDVVAGEIYRDDLSVEDILRLASLHILVVCLQQEESSLSSNQPTRKSSKKKSLYPLSKFNLKLVEKEFGLSRFLPSYVLELVTSQSKEYRKTLQQCIKMSYNSHIMNSKGSGNNGGSKLSPPESPSLNAGVESLEVLLPQIRMQYIKSLSYFNLYGGRYFEVTILAVNESDIILLVGHHHGISQLINSKTKMVSVFANFSSVQLVEVAPQQPSASKTKVKVKFEDIAPLVMSMPLQSALNFAHMISGYCRVHDNNDMMLTLPIPESMTAPKYLGPHRVKSSYWNFPADADSSSSFHCNFSEKVDFSLIAEEIPESVRAMFQQSRVEEEDGENISKYETEEEIPGSSSDIEAQTPVDEGVAMPTVDQWPKSSASSDVSTSPSSGIGSVASTGDPSKGERIVASSSKDGSAAQPRKSDSSEEEPWNELTVYDEAPSSDQEHEKSPPHDVAEVDATDHDSALTAENDCKDDVEVANQSEVLESGASDDEGSATERMGESGDKAEQSDENPADKSDPESPQPLATPRLKLSSFIPPSSSTSRDVPDDVISGDVISSREFQARLGGASLTHAVPPAHLEGDTTDIVTSPLPVTDLARGHKSLKAEKKKNRFSWGGSLPRSVSADAEAEKSKKTNTLFRNFFSTRRAYSMNDDKQKSNVSFDDEPRAKKKWSFFGIFRSSSSSKKKSRFSIFRRKRKSHDLQTPQFGEGAYSVFAETSKSAPDAMKQAASYDDITMREKEVPQTKPRPVSFMTFQKPHSDDESDESTPPTPETEHQLRIPVKKDSVQMKESQKERPRPKKVPAPAVPSTHVESSSLDEENVESSNINKDSRSSTEESVEAESTSTNDYESLEEVIGDTAAANLIKVKRKAPPPPLPLTNREKRQEEASSQEEELYELPGEEEEPLYVEPNVAKQNNAPLTNREIRQEEPSSQEEELYEIPEEEEEPLYVEPNVAEQNKADMEWRRTESGAEEYQSFSETDEDMTRKPVEMSQAEEESYVSVDEDNAVNPALLEQRDRVQTDEDDAGSSVASFKESTDDLATQIFSVLNKSLDEDHNIATEVADVAARSDESSDESEEEDISKDIEDETTIPPQESEDAVVVSDVDELVEHMANSSPKEDQFSSSDEDESDKEIISEPAVPPTFLLQEETPKIEDHPQLDIEENKGKDSDIDDINPVLHQIVEDRWNVVDSLPPKEDLDEDQTEDADKPEHFTNVLNRLLMNGLDNEQWKEEDNSTSGHNMSSKNHISDSEDSTYSNSDEEHEKVSENGLENFADLKIKSNEEANQNPSEYTEKPEPLTSSTEIPSELPAVTDVSKIEPVHEAAKLDIPTIIPPPKEFNVSAKNENHSDGEAHPEPLENQSFEASNGHTSYHPVAPASFAPANRKAVENDVTRDSAKSTSAMYHNLIAPRLFGQKREVKAFAKVRPPTSNKTSPRPAITGHVDYPKSAKNGHLPMGP